MVRVQSAVLPASPLPDIGSSHCTAVDASLLYSNVYIFGIWVQFRLFLCNNKHEVHERILCL